MTSPEPGQVYRSARPADAGWLIRLTDVSATSAAAVEHANGRPLAKRIPLNQLHASARTANGRIRSVGWILGLTATREWAKEEGREDA